MLEPLAGASAPTAAEPWPPARQRTSNALIGCNQTCTWSIHLRPAYTVAKPRRYGVFGGRGPVLNNGPCVE
jgi:hypothetical protein